MISFVMYFIFSTFSICSQRRRDAVLENHFVIFGCSHKCLYLSFQLVFFQRFQPGGQGFFFQSV